MNIAILGLGTVGYGVYDIIKNSNYLKDVNVTKILDKNDSLKNVVGNIITSNYDEILNDDSISVVVETMGAGKFSYDCIKKALLKNKNVITANKEVIASYIDELTTIKNEHNVSLYYEASVGGGIPLIKPVHLVALTNDVSEIKGILNGTTNFILSKMTNENLSFSEALKLAQEKGFAEADPTADLEGLDMVRKIAILSDICYKGFVNIDEIYHYGIKNVSSEDINCANVFGYVIKFIASSKKIDDSVEIRIEPHFVSKDSVISKTDNEFNIVKINASINGELMFYGKGAGRYPTANAIVNDLIMIKNNDLNYSFNNKNEIKILKESAEGKYYLRVKDINKVNQDIIDKVVNNMIITKNIELNSIDMDNIEFYAKIGE